MLRPPLAAQDPERIPAHSLAPNTAGQITLGHFFSRLVTTHPGPIHGGARCCRPRPQRVGKGFPVSTLVKPPPPSRTRRRPLLPLPCARRLTHGCLLFFTLLFLAHGVSTASSTSRIAPKPPPLRRARRPTLPRTEQHTPLFLTQGGLSSRTATSYSSRKAAEPRSLPRAQQFHFLAAASSSWLLLSSRTTYDLLSSRTASPDCVFFIFGKIHQVLLTTSSAQGQEASSEG
jgi:hypothetical protein